MIVGSGEFMLPEEALMVERLVFRQRMGYISSAWESAQLAKLAERYPKQYALCVERGRTATYDQLFGVRK